MKFEYVFQWVGEFPKCIVVDGKGFIRGQSLFQEAISDPVKGHIWDLEKNNCLVHNGCNCVLIVWITAKGPKGCLPYKGQTVFEARRTINEYSSNPFAVKLYKKLLG
ncbi:MAG: hypothetical protein OEZ40_01600 [Candidatus Bathyarchaeota archaeon]|nr:hypothetical protein [Candidatus Bathyarchaeota archaeon]